MKIVRYFFVGAAATTLDFALFALLVHGMGVHYLAAGALSFVIATALNYLLSIRVVFRSGERFARRDEVLLVFAVSAIGLALNQAVLYAGVEGFGLAPLVAKVLATGMVFFWNYGARAHFVFKASRDAAAGRPG